MWDRRLPLPAAPLLHTIVAALRKCGYCDMRMLTSEAEAARASEGQPDRILAEFRLLDKLSRPRADRDRIGRTGWRLHPLARTIACVMNRRASTASPQPTSLTHLPGFQIFVMLEEMLDLLQRDRRHVGVVRDMRHSVCVSFGVGTAMIFSSPPGIVLHFQTRRSAGR